MIKIGRYRHYKGEIMEVIGISLHSETLEEFVIYKHVSGKRAGEPHFWVRPIKMFLEDMEINGKKIPRFEFIE